MRRSTRISKQAQRKYKDILNGKNNNNSPDSKTDTSSRTVLKKTQPTTKSQQSQPLSHTDISQLLNATASNLVDDELLPISQKIKASSLSCEGYQKRFPPHPTYKNIAFLQCYFCQKFWHIECSGLDPDSARLIVLKDIRYPCVLCVVKNSPWIRQRLECEQKAAKTIDIGTELRASNQSNLIQKNQVDIVVQNSLGEASCKGQQEVTSRITRTPTETHKYIKEKDKQERTAASTNPETVSGKENPGKKVAPSDPVTANHKDTGGKIAEFTQANKQKDKDNFLEGKKKKERQIASLDPAHVHSKDPKGKLNSTNTVKDKDLLKDKDIQGKKLAHTDQATDNLQKGKVHELRYLKEQVENLLNQKKHCSI